MNDWFLVLVSSGNVNGSVILLLCPIVVLESPTFSQFTADLDHEFERNITEYIQLIIGYRGTGQLLVNQLVILKYLSITTIIK